MGWNLNPDLLGPAPVSFYYPCTVREERWRRGGGKGAGRLLVFTPTTTVIPDGSCEGLTAGLGHPSWHCASCQLFSTSDGVALRDHRSLLRDTGLTPSFGSSPSSFSSVLSWAGELAFLAAAYSLTLVLPIVKSLCAESHLGTCFSEYLN